MLKQVKLSYLNFLAKQAPEILMKKFSEPWSIDWDMDSPEKSEKILDSIRYHAHPESFERFLLCSALLTGPLIPGWLTDLIIRKVDMDRYLPGWSFQRLKDTRWAVASFPAVLGHAAEICHMVIGACPASRSELNFPVNIGQILEKQSIAQIKSAVSVALQQWDDSWFHFYMLPLFSHSGGPKISGKSHGLSIALTVKSLISQKPIPENLIATGIVDESGKILPVGALDQKAEIASQKGFTLFLFPLQGTVEFPCWGFPVTSVDDAWMIARLFSPEHTHQLMFLGEITRLPEIFIDKLDQIPAFWFKNSDFQNRLELVMDQIQCSTTLSSKLVKKCCKKFETLEMETRLVRADLMSEKIIRDMVFDDPEQALVASTFHINLCNRTGDTTGARQWIRIGDTVEKKVRNVCLDSVVRYWNHRLVARHNRYRFDPSIESELTTILDMYGKHYQTDCRLGYNRRPNFGELCGTIAQNFGFCGPAFLDQVRYYTCLAQEAFGMIHCPDSHKNEWRRQFNYLAYALIDAGKFEEGRDILCRYLGIDTLQNLSDMPPNHFSSWEYALICRYFSDTGSNMLSAKLVDWIENASSFLPKSYPGHLWACNLGKIMIKTRSTNKAEKWFRRSLELCLSAHIGPTVRVMVLLPLSNMFTLDLLTRNDLAEFEKPVLEAVNILDKQHFNIINQLDFTDILDKVYRFPETLFPFSYR